MSRETPRTPGTADRAAAPRSPRRGAAGGLGIGLEQVLRLERTVDAVAEAAVPTPQKNIASPW